MLANNMSTMMFNDMKRSRVPLVYCKYLLHLNGTSSYKLDELCQYDKSRNGHADDNKQKCQSTKDL